MDSTVGKMLASALGWNGQNQVRASDYQGYEGGRRSGSKWKTENTLISPHACDKGEDIGCVWRGIWMSITRCKPTTIKGREMGDMGQ